MNRVNRKERNRRVLSALDDVRPLNRKTEDKNKTRVCETSTQLPQDRASVSSVVGGTEA